MKFSQRLTVTKNRCPLEIFDAIVRLKPESYRGGGSFHLETQPGDETAARTVNEIVTLCEQSGLKKNSHGTVGAYTHQVHFHYEPSDLQGAPLLHLWTQKRMFKGLNSDQRDERGHVVLPATEAQPTVKIASIWPKPWIVVSDAVRQMLEAGGLAGLKFDGVSIEGHSIHAAPTPFWELRSSVTLPKMINSFPDTSVNFDHVRYLIHGSYGEPHYRESEIQPLGSFDIAHTFERLSGGEPGLIVSQRFYQLCLKNKILLESRPARIDPD